MSDDLIGIQERLQTHKRNLLILEEQAAKYGISPPLHIINGIEHEKEQIALLEGKDHHKPTNERSYSRKKQIAVFSSITKRLERINRKINSLAHTVSFHQSINPTNNKLYDALLSIADTYPKVEIERDYRAFILYCDQNRVFIPNDVNDLIVSYERTFFSNDMLRNDLLYGEQDLSSHLQQHMNALIEIVCKYVK